VTSLPQDFRYLKIILQNIAHLRINLEMRDNKTKQIKEVIMNLSPAYDKWLEKVSTQAATQAATQADKEARISIARNMLQEGVEVAAIIRFTGLSAGEIAQLR
jgi:mevalonate pyrophosphate decarboxylase